MVDVKGKGSDPWVLTLRKNVFRTGAPAMILNGMSNFTRCIEQPMIVLVFPIQGILAKGIGFQNYPEFLASPHGAMFIAEICTVVRLTAGQTFFTPFGYGVHLIYLTQESKIIRVPDWAHCWVVTSWTKHDADDARVKFAVRDYNLGYLTSKVGEIPYFKDRQERFTAAFEEEKKKV